MAPVIVPHPNTIRGPIEETHNALRDARVKLHTDNIAAEDADFHADLAVLQANKEAALLAAGLNTDGGVPDSYPGPLCTVRPAITGTKTEGSTLTCSAGTWVNKVGAVAYQWVRDGDDISGATAATRVLNQADVDAGEITCRVTATNTLGTSSKEALPVDITEPPVPTNSVAPAISGTQTSGQTVTCSTGTWANADTYTYQWMRDGVAIGGATANTRVLAGADVGHVMKCQVTAHNENPAASAPVDSNSFTPAS
jgi:hypothetical protein